MHEHFSVPFYMDGSDKAAVDLKPDRLADGAPSECAERRRRVYRID